nr:MAG TPA: hypothetical protein [Caudoviricetes sp.]
MLFKVFKERASYLWKKIIVYIVSICLQFVRLFNCLIRLIIKSFKSLRFHNLIILFRIVVQFPFRYKCLSVTLVEILIE